MTPPQFQMIAFNLLDEPPYPMRVQMGQMPFDELVASIRAKGVLEPLLVRAVNGRYQVIAGHRRMKASGVAALMEVPCLVHECSDQEAAELMIQENTGREELSAAEEGWSYLELVERFHLSEEQLCNMVHKSVGYINERLDLVRNDPEIAAANAEGKLVFSVARELLRVNHYTAATVLRCDPAQIPEEKREAYVQHRRYLLDLCINSGATARVARSYVEQWKQSFVQMQPYKAPEESGNGATAAQPALPRCLLCGRDGDQQNLRPLYVHWFEKDSVLKLIRSAGVEVYE